MHTEFSKKKYKFTSTNSKKKKKKNTWAANYLGAYIKRMNTPCFVIPITFVFTEKIPNKTSVGIKFEEKLTMYFLRVKRDNK